MAKHGAAVAVGEVVRAVVVVVALAGCIGPQQVQRTVRVPHPAAPLWSGAPMQAPVELSGGASSILDFRDPHLHDPSASVEVPKAQIRGELRIRYRRYAQLAFTYEHGIASTYHALDPTQPRVSSGGATGVGLALRYSMPLDGAPGVTIGLGLEPRLWGLPFVEYSADGGERLLSETAMIATLAFSLTPAYRAGPWTFFAGLYAMPHPTVERAGREPATSQDDEVQGGDYNLILHAGAEFQAGSVSMLLQIQRDMSASPALYGPSIGVALAVRLPEWVGSSMSHVPPP